MTGVLCLGGTVWAAAPENIAPVAEITSNSEHSAPHLTKFVANGTQACGKAVFKDTNVPDYQAILKTFEPIGKMLEQTPRMDMAAPQ